MAQVQIKQRVQKITSWFTPGNEAKVHNEIKLSDFESSDYEEISSDDPSDIKGMLKERPT